MTDDPTRPVKLAFYLRAEQIEWLRAEQQRTGVPVTEIIRRAVDRERRAREEAHGDG